MVVSWPKRIKDTGALREQFMHLIDVVPTILEVTGVSAPEYVDGIEQAPIEGTSFAYTFDEENAKAPSRHKTQYFEMMGQWALYHEGWLLATKVNRAPWEAYGAANPDPLNNQVLQLYNLNEDFTQSKDLADQYPDKLKELKKLFIEEAKKYQVFPMDASVATRVIAPRPNITAGRKEFVYTRPMIGLPQGDSPLLLNTSYTITADIEVPKGGAEGMILTSGGRFAGYGWEWANLAFLAGGVWLWQRRAIHWHIPVAMLAGLFVTALLFYIADADSFASPLFHLFSGATMLGAFFIATDPVSAATTPRGRLYYGAGIGVLVYVIRTWGGYPDGVAFAVLLMNMAAPTIDYYTQPRVFGHEDSSE